MGFSFPMLSTPPYLIPTPFPGSNTRHVIPLSDVSQFLIISPCTFPLYVLFRAWKVPERLDRFTVLWFCLFVCFVRYPPTRSVRSLVTHIHTHTFSPLSGVLLFCSYISFVSWVYYRVEVSHLFDFPPRFLLVPETGLSFLIWRNTCAW